MKKVFALIVTFILLFVNAYACDTNFLPQEVANNTYVSCSYWAVDTESQELFGIVSPQENVDLYHTKPNESQYVRGFSSNGLIRKRGRQFIVQVGDSIEGLTLLQNVRIEINSVYNVVVEEIVTRRTGCAVCAKTIVASTMWNMGNTVAHIFFRENANVFIVGTVYFNGGKDSTFLWCGDFDGDSLFELGFMAGTNDVKPTPTQIPFVFVTPDPNPTPKPTSKPKSKPTTPTYVDPTPAPCPELFSNKECSASSPSDFKLCFNLSLQLKGCVKITKNCEN